MYGRYGNDHLNMAIMLASLAVGVFAMFVGGLVDLVLTLVQFMLLGLWVMRAFSRNISKRREENMAFLRFWTKFKKRFNNFSGVTSFFARLKDREHKYFKCPNCKSRLRVPRGRGMITISCPRCKTKFDKKS